MNDNAYEELKDLAKFCLVLRIPYSEALHMPDEVRQAFVEAFNEIQDEQAKQMKKR